MNVLKYKGKWNDVAGKLRQKYKTLTDEDLVLEIGKEEELLGRLEAKLGKTKEDLHQLIGSI